ncbi:MAG: BolA family transcriptional regulator [Pseudomonadales bacterium]|nr:BolA family transcriptional regulator [Pseudomonadales bacterium]
MAMTAAQIEILLKSAFPDAVIELTDTAGDGDHWRARIVSAAFRGKTRVQQHQLVYGAIGPEMGGALHALALHTEVPA